MRCDAFIVVLLSRQGNQVGRFDCRRRLQKSHFAQLSHLVQIAEVRLPPNSNDAEEDAAKVEGDESEADDGGSRPDLPGVQPAGRNGGLDAVDGRREGVARQQRLAAEEVGEEDGGEAKLVDDDLCSEREDA